MRVLILANYAQGLLSFRRELVERLTCDYEVIFCVPEGPEDNYVKELVSRGASHVQCQHLSRRGTNPAEDLQLLLFYIRLIRRVKPGAVLTYTIKPNVYGGIASTACRIPYIANVTGLGMAVEHGGALQTLTLALYKLGLRHARKVFFQNASNRDFMLTKNVVTTASDLLPGSGVNTERFALSEYPSNAEECKFITVGRIMRDKGISELLEAARTIKSRHPNVMFCLLGSFDESWETEVSEAVSEGIVEHIPQQPDVRPYVAECHAIVHPSWHEGMSNVCLEAASMGRPILASDIPGCRETFEDGVSGISFKPKNSKSLAETLECFINLTWEEKRAMGLAGRERVVREFDREIVINKYLDEIETIEKESKNA